MPTPNQILHALPDAELRQMVIEVLAWQRTGTLPGTAVRNLAERLVAEAGLSEEGVLRDSDTLIMCEAASRFAAMD